MGGGDLNLKKSWHPSTLRNIERVWKAEQMRDQERAKIEQLQKELEEERNKQEMRQYAENKGVVKKRQERLDWMYQGVAGLVDREQYLLGRKVDKNFEIAKKEEDGVEDKNEGLQPGAIFTMAPTNAAVDLENKIREDPLFTIRKQEMKTKKTLLSNPVKMKHLRDMVEQSIKKSERAHKKNRKKEHKKKRSSSSGSEDGQPRHSRVKPKRDHKRTHSAVLKRPIKSSTKEEEDKKGPKFGLLIRGDQSWKKEPGLAPVKAVPEKKPEITHRHRPLSEEEKAAARKEMMQNAHWRDEQRKALVSQYRKSDTEEKHCKGEGFIRPMLEKAADSGSVENRIKQRMYTVQRGAMDSHFARK